MIKSNGKRLSVSFLARSGQNIREPIWLLGPLSKTWFEEFLGSFLTKCVLFINRLSWLKFIFFKLFLRKCYWIFEIQMDLDWVFVELNVSVWNWSRKLVSVVLSEFCLRRAEKEVSGHLDRVLSVYTNLYDYTTSIWWLLILACYTIDDIPDSSQVWYGIGRITC